MGSQPSAFVLIMQPSLSDSVVRYTDFSDFDKNMNFDKDCRSEKTGFSQEIQIFTHRAMINDLEPVHFLSWSYYNGSKA